MTISYMELKPLKAVSYKMLVCLLFCQSLTNQTKTKMLLHKN